MISTEKNIEIRNLVRSDLRRLCGPPPLRVFYKRGGWRPRASSEIEYIDGTVEEGETPVVPVPSWPYEDVIEYRRISISTAAAHTIIYGAVGRKIRITFLTFTVGGEVNVTLYSGGEAITGPMDFGAVYEPRGIVLPTDGNYLEIDTGRDFSILLSAAVQVSGFCLFKYVG